MGSQVVSKTRRTVSSGRGLPKDFDVPSGHFECVDRLLPDVSRVIVWRLSVASQIMQACPQNKNFLDGSGVLENGREEYVLGVDPG